MLRCFLSLLLAGSLSAAVVITRDGSRIRVEIDGQPFTDLYFGPDSPKPYLHPLRAPSGKIVTRRFPMEQVPGETTTDQHHRGLWLGYGNINGFNFWETEFSYNNPKAGKVVTKAIDQTESGAIGKIAGRFDWLSPSGEVLLEEARTMLFHSGAGPRIVDFDITLKAVAKTTFGDSKDGFFAIRVAEPLNERHSGALLNSEGGRAMAQTWGKPANWVDYSGDLDGEKLGIALFEHPSSFHYPPRWHVRDYGLLAANPFAANAFDKQLAESSVVLQPGQTVHLRYRVVIHGVASPADLAGWYRDYVKQ
jgi:hypothetical protein